MAKTDLTAERLRELLSYDPETGVFCWKTRFSRSDLLGKIAGTETARGYWIISIDGDRYLAHRLVWLYVYGVWPVDQLDHTNGIKTDNRVVNLRESTQAENMQNKRSKKGDGKLNLGAHYVKERGKWVAAITVNRVQKYLGIFKTQEEAHAAYAAAKLKYHKFSPVAYSQQ